MQLQGTRGSSGAALAPSHHRAANCPPAAPTGPPAETYGITPPLPCSSAVIWHSYNPASAAARTCCFSRSTSRVLWKNSNSPLCLALLLSSRSPAASAGPPVASCATAPPVQTRRARPPLRLPAAAATGRQTPRLRDWEWRVGGTLMACSLRCTLGETDITAIGRQIPRLLRDRADKAGGQPQRRCVLLDGQSRRSCNKTVGNAAWPANWDRGIATPRLEQPLGH